MTTTTPRTKRVGNIEGEVLAESRRGDGKHIVLRAPLPDGPQARGDEARSPWVVVKVYGRKRPLLRTMLWWFGHRVLTGKSSVTVMGRAKTERELLSLWREHGFDVPAIREEPKLEGAQPYLVLEGIEGPTLNRLIADPEVSHEVKKQHVVLLARSLGERHRRALEHDEPRLIHEHPTLDHILVDGERLRTFDFEVAYTKRHSTPCLISTEIVGFLKSLSKCSGEAFPSLLETFVAAYPHKELLGCVEGHLLKGSMPGFKWIVSLDRRIRGEKPHNKFRIAQSLKDCLKARSHS